MQDVPDLRLGVLASGNSNSGMLIDVHAHFYYAGAPRSHWRERNASRLAAGRKIGVTIHVASILGSWGRTSPIYFPSPRDVEAGNTPPRARAGASRRDTRVRHGEPQLYVSRARRDRALPRRRDGGGQAGGEPPRDRPAARPDLRAGAGTGGAGAAPRVAAPDARLAGAGSVGRTRARGLGHAPPPGAIHPRAHRRGRRLGALISRPPRYAQRVCGSLGERRGRRHARSVPRGRRCGAPALGNGPHDGHRVGQAALSGAPASAGRPGARAMEERGPHLSARRVPRRLMRIDVNAFLGAYPYRRVPGTSPDGLLQAMARAGIDEAWVSHLPSLFWRQPMEGNAWLYATAAREPRLKPVPALHPGLSGWEGALGEAADRAAPAGRCDPLYYGLDPAGPEMRVLAAACGAAHLPLMMAVRLEDGRQRHPNDRAAELPAAAVRALIRSDEDLRLLITHADRGFIEEVHFGSTPEEAARLWWDVSWIWGPPEDHLETLLGTIGIDRFVFGTGQPLRIPEASVAKVDLLDLAPAQRAAIDSENTRGGLLR